MKEGKAETLCHKRDSHEKTEDFCCDILSLSLALSWILTGQRKEVSKFLVFPINLTRETSATEYNCPQLQMCSHLLSSVST